MNYVVKFLQEYYREVILVGLIFLLVLVTAAFVAGETTISPGGDFNFTFVNASNETDYELFICESQNASAVCSLQEFFLELTPGEINRTVSSAYCSVTASCSDPDDVDDDLCVVDAVIERGDDDYRNTGGVCDIDVEVANDYCEDFDIDLYTITESVGISKDRRNLCIEYDNQRECFPGNVSSFNYEFPVELSCPKDVAITNQDFEDELIVTTYCRELLPLTVQKLAETYDNCIDGVQSNADVRAEEQKKCEDDKRGLRETLSKAQSDLSTCQAARNAETQLKVLCQDELSSTKTRSTGGTIMAVFGWVFAVLGWLMAGIQFMARRKK